jgi:hypothetical protein
VAPAAGRKAAAHGDAVTRPLPGPGYRRGEGESALSFMVNVYGGVAGMSRICLVMPRRRIDGCR